MPDTVLSRPTSAIDVPDTTPDSDLATLLTAFRLLQTQHARVLHHESASRGLNPTDARFAFYLAAADGQGVTPKQAGEYLELSTGAMTSLIDRLEQRGHIERRPNPDDRRSILVRLTPSGSEVAREIGSVYGSAFREVIAPDDRLLFAGAFDRLGDALEAHSRTVGEAAAGIRTGS